MWLNIAILSLVTLQRLVELYIARRNTNRLIARGGHEAGSNHYWLIVVFHAVWIIGLWVYARDNPVNWNWLFAYLAIEALRGWVVAALGDRWTTRIIVMPGEPLVERGPYRYLRHPQLYRGDAGDLRAADGVRHVLVCGGFHARQCSPARLAHKGGRRNLQECAAAREAAGKLNRKRHDFH